MDYKEFGKRILDGKYRVILEAETSGRRNTMRAFEITDVGFFHDHVELQGFAANSDDELSPTTQAEIPPHAWDRLMAIVEEAPESNIWVCMWPENFRSEYPDHYSILTLLASPWDHLNEQKAKDWREERRRKKTPEQLQREDELHRLFVGRVIVGLGVSSHGKPCVTESMLIDYVWDGTDGRINMGSGRRIMAFRDDEIKALLNGEILQHEDEDKEMDYILMPRAASSDDCKERLVENE